MPTQDPKAAGLREVMVTVEPGTGPGSQRTPQCHLRVEGSHRGNGFPG